MTFQVLYPHIPDKNLCPSSSFWVRQFLWCNLGSRLCGLGGVRSVNMKAGGWSRREVAVRKQASVSTSLSLPWGGLSGLKMIFRQQSNVQCWGRSWGLGEPDSPGQKIALPRRPLPTSHHLSSPPQGGKVSKTYLALKFYWPVSKPQRFQPLFLFRNNINHPSKYLLLKLLGYWVFKKEFVDWNKCFGFP